jgi:hypothetical protein
MTYCFQHKLGLSALPQVLSPAGKIKAKITLPYRAPTVGEFATRSYKEIKPALALSADGNYAYLSASMPGNAKQVPITS